MPIEMLPPSEYKIVLWMSRFEPTETQVETLKRMYGRSTVISRDPNPFSDASDVAQRYLESGAVDIVFVGPLWVLKHLCDAGLHPLYAHMRPSDKKFIRFQRIMSVNIEFQDVPNGEACVPDEERLLEG